MLEANTKRGQPSYISPFNFHINVHENHLTTENRKIMKQIWKLKVEREELHIHMKDTTPTVQNVSDVVDIPGNVWWKANMFDAELKNADHVFGTKIITHH